jgi:hypothetical protein
LPSWDFSQKLFLVNSKISEEARWLKVASNLFLEDDGDCLHNDRCMMRGNSSKCQFFLIDFISAGSNKSFWMEDFSKCQFEEFSKCRFEESSKCRFKEFSKSLDAKIVESSKVTCQMRNWSLEVFYKRWRKWWNFLSIETVVFFNVSSSRWK